MHLIRSGEFLEALLATAPDQTPDGPTLYPIWNFLAILTDGIKPYIERLDAFVVGIVHANPLLFGQHPNLNVHIPSIGRFFNEIQHRYPVSACQPAAETVRNAESCVSVFFHNYMTNEYADNEIKDFYENVVVRHGDIEDFFAENSDYNSKAAIVAYVIQNEASDDTPRRLVDGFTFDDDDKEDRPCVAASKRKIEAWQKEHPGNGFNLKVFSDTLKKYADELGLEFGDVYYYLVVEDDKADEMGVRV